MTLGSRCSVPTSAARPISTSWRRILIGASHANLRRHTWPGLRHPPPQDAWATAPSSLLTRPFPEPWAPSQPPSRVGPPPPNPLQHSWQQSQLCLSVRTTSAFMGVPMMASCTNEPTPHFWCWAEAAQSFFSLMSTFLTRSHYVAQAGLCGG